TDGAWKPAGQGEALFPLIPLPLRSPSSFSSTSRPLSVLFRSFGRADAYLTLYTLLYVVHRRAKRFVKLFSLHSLRFEPHLVSLPSNPAASDREADLLSSGSTGPEEGRRRTKRQAERR
ncbi:hypothetical protein BJY59DRAFT_728015, partial [Rhodotorula toruloides]